ncbi:universal stress protein [Comamonadaceae bacterium OH3737_COT-264]|nr:universal stress protein [Comamonadaceae bacterium OH3737_COT-264]
MRYQAALRSDEARDSSGKIRGSKFRMCFTAQSKLPSKRLFAPHQCFARASARILKPSLKDRPKDTGKQRSIHKPRSFSMYQHILIPTDGSELSQKAVSHGFDLAKLSGARVTILTATPSYPVTYMEGSAASNREFAETSERQWREDARRAMEKVLEQGKAMGLQAEVKVLSGESVSDLILDTANEVGADLIVMASHGRKGIARLLLGSETQHVLTRATVPVLVLR